MDNNSFKDNKRNDDNSKNKNNSKSDDNKKTSDDQKAIRLLKKYNIYNNSLSEEEIQYCIEKGVMFEPLTLDHDDVIDEIKERAGGIPMKDAVNAFLYSISTGDLRYRTILSSVVWGKSLKPHKFVSTQRYHRNYQWCDVCSICFDEDTGKCNQNLNGYNRYRYFSGEQDICQAGYVLLDLREYEKLPKVTYSAENIRILNRIFGLAEELGMANKVVALQKLITQEKFFKATKNEINSILGVLSICGVFDTPEHKSAATHFTENINRGFEMECDLFYPLNHWRGKHGINYDAVKKVFGPVVGDCLDKSHAICGEVKRNLSDKKKKSKAEQYFKDGEHFLELSNEYRYYYGLSKLEKSWDKVVKYSTTYNIYKRTEIYFEGNVVCKIIYEEIYGNIDSRLLYREIDMNVPTIERSMVLPKTSRGRKQPLTPTLLMTPTYMEEQLEININKTAGDNSYIVSFNSANDQMLPLPLPRKKIQNQEDFECYTKEYISDLPENYDSVLENFRNKKRVTVKFHSGAIFRVSLSPKTYTYGLILGKVRDILKWDEIPKKHPIQMCMAQPVIYRQYDIVTENGNMTPDDLRDIPLRAMDIAQDNDILWETYPIIGYKKLEEKDIDLGFNLVNDTVIFGFGMHTFEKNTFSDISESIKGAGSSYSTRLAIYVADKKSVYEEKSETLRRMVEKKLGLDSERGMDEFAMRYGGMTRRQFIELAEKRGI